MWVDCGRPRDGAVADVMRRTRVAYLYAIRQTRQEDNTIIRDRVAASLLEDTKRNFWKEVKRIRGNKAVSSRLVDGLTDAGDVAHLFASRYRDLYTSVPYNIDEMQVILNDSSLDCMLISKDCIFSVFEVEDAVSRLKPHKIEGSSELATDHFINGGRDCLSLSWLSY